VRALCEHRNVNDLEGGPPPGPHNPLPTTPRPAPASVRRTWNVDISFPQRVSGSTLAEVRGRDLRTGTDGTSESVDELEVTVEIDPTTATIIGVDVGRASASLDVLFGICLRSGFGRELAERLQPDATDRSLCFSALEGLGGAYLVSGYSHLHSGLIPQTREIADAAAEVQADVCIGWAREGSLIENIRRHGRTPIPIGPTAPEIAGDPSAWHDMATLAPTTVRRRRRIDVFPPPLPGGLMRVQQHFRDSHAGAEGESVMHEYLVDAAFDNGGRLVEIHVDARVLPWDACPGAVAGAQRLVGVALTDISARIRSDLASKTACTHLNSTLRALADAPSLAHLMAE
jgi:Protein of unknown function (DUF2889)